jgi:hypothetical protein
MMELKINVKHTVSWHRCREQQIQIEQIDKSQMARIAKEMKDRDTMRIVSDKYERQTQTGDKQMGEKEANC